MNGNRKDGQTAPQRQPQSLLEATQTELSALCLRLTKHVIQSMNGEEWNAQNELPVVYSCLADYFTRLSEESEKRDKEAHRRQAVGIVPRNIQDLIDYVYPAVLASSAAHSASNADFEAMVEQMITRSDHQTTDVDCDHVFRLIERQNQTNQLIVSVSEMRQLLNSCSTTFNITALAEAADLSCTLSDLWDAAAFQSSREAQQQLHSKKHNSSVNVTHFIAVMISLCPSRSLWGLLEILVMSFFGRYHDEHNCSAVVNDCSEKRFQDENSLLDFSWNPSSSSRLIRALILSVQVLQSWALLESALSDNCSQGNQTLLRLFAHAVISSVVSSAGSYAHGAKDCQPLRFSEWVNTFCPTSRTGTEHVCGNFPPDRHGDASNNCDVMAESPIRLGMEALSDDESSPLETRHIDPFWKMLVEEG